LSSAADIIVGKWTPIKIIVMFFVSASKLYGRLKKKSLKKIHDEDYLPFCVLIIVLIQYSGITL